jgi:membrane associated rhomboid family serine protease
MLDGIGPASLVILAVNIGIGLATLANRQLIERLVFRPYDYARDRNRYTIIASAFAHADVWHLVFNMITFYYFGARLLEWRIGTLKFITLYTLGLVLSQLGSYRKHRNNPAYATLGASGAISAVLFAAVVYFPTESLYLFLIPVPIPAPLFAVGYLAYTWWAARQERGRINHDAHLGGALTGLAFVAITDLRAWSRAIDLVFG